VARPGAQTLTFSLDQNGDGKYDAGDLVFFFGAPGDRVVVGDWTGSDMDKIGVARPAPDGAGLFFLLDNLAGGTNFSPDYFGAAQDVPVIGDWTGNGADKVGVYRPSLDALDLAFSLDGDGDGRFEPGSDPAFAFPSMGGPTTHWADQVVAGKWRP
jgi:hypothetical protein